MGEETEQVKGRLVAEAVEAMAAVLTKEVIERLQKGQISLREIEEQVLSIQRQVGTALTQAMVDEVASGEASSCPCPDCGREMRQKGRKSRQLVSRTGTSRLQRSYYYCPRCRKGHFPPG
jgi:uncharacterized protein with PIN domain